MSYQKAMRHWRNPRKHKLTATRIRGGILSHAMTGDSPPDISKAEETARKLKGK